jgi:hypothetical protein
VQSLGGGRICVASFGGAARAWLTKYDFVGMFDIDVANMSCPHLSLFYRYVRCPRVRRRGVRARLRLAGAAPTGA